MKRNIKYLLLIFVFGYLIFNSLNQKKPDTLSPGLSLEELSESDNFSTFPYINSQDKDSVLARINDTVVTRTEVDREMDNLFQEFQNMAFPEKTNEFNSKLWRQALENVINRTILFQQAERENIRPEKEIIDMRIAEIKKHFSSHKKFRQQLAHLGISEEKLRQEIEYDLKIKMLLDLHIPSVSEVNNEEVEEFYHTNSENFQIPERVRASHILITVSSKESLDKRKEERNKLSRLKKEIEKGADFSELARKHSDCESKSRGGDLGFFKRGKMVRPFEDTAFNLKVGEISEIVETIYGYHLIKLTDYKPAQAVPFEQVQNKIVSFLKRQKRDLYIREYLFKLRDNADIEYFEDFK
ncbi:MAG: peptidylprolyl isomerase [bacterium]